MESIPHCGLPAANEHRYYVQRQAQPRHTTDCIQMGMLSLKDRVVVELRLVRNTESTPVTNHSRDYGSRVDCRSQPPFGETAGQRNRVEYFHIPVAVNHKALDDIESVQLRASGSQLWKLPTRRRRKPTNFPLPAQRSTSQLDATNRPYRRQRFQTTLFQFAMKDHCFKFSQRTFFAESATN